MSSPWIPDSNRWWDSGLLELFSGFKSPGFRILQAKFPGFQNPDFHTWGDMLHDWYHDEVDEVFQVLILVVNYH